MRFVSALCVLSAAVLLACSVASASAGPDAGKKVFEARRCGSCHQTEGPAREKTIADQLAKKGPELWYVGNKLKRGFLASWLADPRPIRPLKYNSLTERNPGDHPRLSVQEAASVTDYLMTLTSRDVRPSGVRARVNPRGRVIFIKKLACYGCHSVRVRGKIAGGLSGPTFVGASSRLNPDWVYAFLVNPKVFKPVKDMPVYAGILKSSEMKALAAYVCALD
ncbi:MAG: c-type cytochrome [Thermodesulfobacteriota bacterium]